MEWAVYEPVQSSGVPDMLPQQNQVRKMQAPEVPSKPQENEVKVPEPKQKKTELADISEYDETTDLFYVVAASVVGTVLLLILVRTFPEIFGKNLNLLFNRFKLLAVVAYVLMMSLIIGVSRYIYSEFIFLKHDWNPLYFTLVAGGTQLVHDLTMYYGVVKTFERGTNSIIDLLKDYAESGGSRILFGNAFLTSIVTVSAIYLKGAPPHVVASVTGLAAYMIPFMLESKNEFSNIS
jgi:hypothetical protein